MSDKETEALARQLWAIYDETWPNGAVLAFDDLQTYERTAWIMVAQFVGRRDMNTEHRAMYGTDLYEDPLQDLMDKYPDHR